MLDRGEMLFLAGEPARGLFVIVSGSIRAFRVNANGREQTIHVETAGATLAEVPVFDDGKYPATAVAEAPSEVLFLSKADVQQFFIANPAIALNALRVMAGRLRRHAELVDSLALKDVGQQNGLVRIDTRSRGITILDEQGLERFAEGKV
jgi:CRP/FNR family transcriptional regulator, dissimilatory nitrate respiration regulator